METVRVAGIEIAYARRGAGPPLVLIHGAAGDSRLWGPQLEGLAGELDVIAWDEPGAGRSGDPSGDFDLAGYARCLATLIETVAAGPVHALGLSWGGTVALELYRSRPDLVGTLILADTYAGWKGSLPPTEVRARVEGAERMLAMPDGRFDPTLPGLFADEPPPELVSLMERIAADVRPASMRRQLAIMAEADLCDVLPRIAVPTLLIWGERDARSPSFVANSFESMIPGAELVLIPGAGHLSNLERPDAFNEAVLRFCRAHPGHGG